MALLRVKGLTKYFGGLKAVSDFNLELERGALIGLIGPNGAGKTTVFNLITGIYAPSRGSIHFEGEEITGLKPFEITKRGIARTFQNIRLFQNLSVLDNVRTAYHFRTSYGLIPAILRNGSYHQEEEEIIDLSMELLRIFNLHLRYHELAKNLPYGEQRRLEIVRALATSPKLLLLDEPAAGMNPKEIERLMALVEEIRERYSLTILLIEHQMRFVMGICERIKVLDFGETIAEGTPSEVQKNPKVIEAYLGEEVA